MKAGDRQAGPSRWWLCGLLLAATVLSYLDRQALSLTADQLIAEYGLSQEQFGGILAAFRHSYALFQLAGGWLVDAFGVRLIYPAAIGLWSVAGAMTAFAPGIGSISACRFVLGAGEAFNWPSALRTTEQMMEPAERPLANGIFNSGAALGALLAPPVVTWLTMQFGWRSAFVATGATGLVWIGVWQVYTRRHASRLTAGGLAVKAVPPVLFGILKKRAFWTLAVSAVVVNSASYFLADWIPLYLKTERGFSFELGNALSMFIYGGLDLGNLLAGLYVRKLTSCGWGVREARHSAMLISCVLMSAAALAGAVSSRYLTLALLVVTAIGVTGFLVIYLSLVQEVDPEHVGATAGLLGGLGNFSYALAAPSIGRLADLHQTGLTFLVIGVLPWLAFLSVRLGQQERKAVVAR